MIEISKKLLTELESKIGLGSTVIVVLDEIGITFIAETKNENSVRHHFSRSFSFKELRNSNSEIIIDVFTNEAIFQLTKYLSNNTDCLNGVL